MPSTIETRYPSRKYLVVWEAGEGWKIIFLPKEEPLEWKLWNFAMRFPKRTGDSDFMLQGFADLIVVVVKPVAYEDMVTYLRIKLTARNRDVKGKGSDMLMESWNS